MQRGQQCVRGGHGVRGSPQEDLLTAVSRYAPGRAVLRAGGARACQAWKRVQFEALQCVAETLLYCSSDVLLPLSQRSCFSSSANGWMHVRARSSLHTLRTTREAQRWLQSASVPVWRLYRSPVIRRRRRVPPKFTHQARSGEVAASSSTCWAACFAVTFSLKPRLLDLLHNRYDSSAVTIVSPMQLVYATPTMPLLAGL